MFALRAGEEKLTQVLPDTSCRRAHSFGLSVPLDEHAVSAERNLEELEHLRRDGGRAAGQKFESSTERSANLAENQFVVDVEGSR